MMMKTRLDLALAATAILVAFVMPARAGAQPATQPSADAQAPVQTKPEKQQKRTVAPHNHMRDAKGIWVPEKKPRKASKKEADATAKDAASAQPAK